MDELQMDANASDAMVHGIMARLYLVGHYLTPRQVESIHRIITDAEQDTRMDSKRQSDVTEFVKDKIERDDYNEERGTH